MPAEYFLADSPCKESDTEAWPIETHSNASVMQITASESRPIN